MRLGDASGPYATAIPIPNDWVAKSVTTDERRFAASSLLRLLRHHLTETTFCAEPRARPVVVAIPNRILDWLGPALEAVAQDKAHRAA